MKMVLKLCFDKTGAIHLPILGGSNNTVQIRASVERLAVLIFIVSVVNTMAPMTVVLSCYECLAVCSHIHSRVESIQIFRFDLISFDLHPSCGVLTSSDINKPTKWSTHSWQTFQTTCICKWNISRYAYLFQYMQVFIYIYIDTHSFTFTNLPVSVKNECRQVPESTKRMSTGDIPSMSM